jgi:hypothetical protein
MYGQLETARILLDHGANPNVRDSSGITPLMQAADGGHLALAKLLIDHGATIHVAAHSGETAITLALDKGHRAVVKLLQEAGATRPRDYLPRLDTARLSAPAGAQHETGYVADQLGARQLGQIRIACGGVPDERIDIRDLRAFPI